MPRRNRSRLPILITVLALLLAACATAEETGDSAPATSAPTTSTSTEAPDNGSDATTSTDGSDGGDAASTTTEGSTDVPEGPPAPDFTLALGADGADAFMLSQEVMPVFMVFWAEW